MRIGVVVLLMVWLPAIAQAQLQDHHRRVKVTGATITLDTASLVSGSVRVKGNAQFRIEYGPGDGTVRLTALQTPAPDSVDVSYRTFPFAMTRTRAHRSLASYDVAGYLHEQPAAPSGLTRQSVLPDHTLQKSGSLTRGISMGNAQNMTVNSSMNLTLEGKLTDDLRLRAVLSDQNVPYQPEGNTQNIQHLDQMIVELSGKNFAATAGDLIYKSDGTQFLKFNRNSKGLTATVRSKAFGGESTTQAGVALVKGRFSIVNLTLAEGVQGPYRIPGPNGEAYVTVLANSERVFFDGRLLERGFNSDYTIDYNMGEITFMNRIIVTRYSRVRVEYQYTNLAYQRTITNVSHQWKNDRAEISANWFSEKDNPFLAVGGSLSDRDLQQLAAASGDGVYLPRVDSTTFSTNGIFYRKADTTDLAGVRHVVYVRSTDPGRAHYQVHFTNLGTGKGNYRQRVGAVGGNYYEWVSPANGVSQGDYEPVTLLTAPLKQQMLEVNARVKMGDHETAYLTSAWSDRNTNILSETGETRKSGMALVSGVSSTGRTLSFLPGYKVSSFVETEWDDRSFHAIDRFRNVDFDRDWSADPSLLATPATDKFLRSGLTLEQGKDNNLNYRFTLRNRGDALAGTQHMGSWSQRLGNVRLEGNGFAMDNLQQQYRAEWKRLDAGVSYQLPGIIPGYAYRMNRNRLSLARTDSIVSSAMNFREHYFYVKNAPGAAQDFQFSHSIREDDVPSLGEMQRATVARTSQLMFKRSGGVQQINSVFTFRQVDYQQATTAKREESLSGRLDWQRSWLQKTLRSDLTYAVSNGRELKRNYAFVQVPAGQGTHTWRDDNRDGKPDLNEFYEAINFDEKNYIKVFLPGTEYVPAYSNLINYRLAMEAPASWRQQSGWKQVLSRFSANHVLLTDYKMSDSDLKYRLLGSLLSVQDNQLISGKQSFRSMLFFNRANPVFGVDVIFNKTSNKRVLTQGMESLTTQSTGLVTRYNAGPEQMLRLSAEQGHKSSASDYLAGRSYDVGYYLVAPEWAWQPHNKFRAAWKVTWQQRVGTPATGDGVSAQHRELSTDVRWNRNASSSLQTIVRMIDIQYSGERNSALGYEMLNALNPGRNFTWSVNAVHKLLNGVQVNINYEGRKSPGANVVHLGRVMVTALF